MKSRRTWQWIGARATGTSHIRTGRLCEDSGSCLELTSGTSGVLLAVVSDGAGTAVHSRIGSSIVTLAFSRGVRQYFSGGGTLGEFDESQARNILDDVR